MRISKLSLVACGMLAAFTGCQNSLERLANYSGDDALETRLAVSSDDPAGLETGRGHLPSLAAELADRRHDAADRADSLRGGSALTAGELLRRGHDADVNGQPREARIYYEQVLAQSPNHPEAHHRLGILADRAGNFAAAEHHYQTALRTNPDDADLLNDMGYSYFLQGRAAESENYLNQAKRLAPRHPHVQENLSLLYDRAKAEKVLMSQMGPRQAQATFARLFQSAPAADSFDRRTAQNPRERNPVDRRTAQNAGADLPHGLEDLQRKMEEARLESIAERQQRNAARHQPEHPAEPYGVPRTLPHEFEPGTVPAGRINEVFRRIDQSGHSHGRAPDPAGLAANRSSEVPAEYDPRTTARTRQPHQSDRLTPESERAAFPEWNAPIPNWPESEAQPAANPVIRQANHSEPELLPPMNAPSRTPTASAADRAAEIGMAAGPGAIFPQWNPGTQNQEAAENPLPATRSLPGTNSRINDAAYEPPQRSTDPPEWQSAPFGQNQRPGDPGRFSGRNQTRPEADRVEAYDQMRADHNAQFNRDQHRLAAGSDLMSTGHPNGETVPGGFDPDRQPWPAYNREQYDTRPMDQPPADYIGPVIVPGSRGGQTAPTTYPAEENATRYNRGW